jgi:hypothetical protein
VKRKGSKGRPRSRWKKKRLGMKNSYVKTELDVRQPIYSGSVLKG